MSEYITLMGAEQVQSAGNCMASAASDMMRAASNLESALCQHQQFMDDWLRRYEAALERYTPAPTS